VVRVASRGVAAARTARKGLSGRDGFRRAARGPCGPPGWRHRACASNQSPQRAGPSLAPSAITAPPGPAPERPRGSRLIRPPNSSTTKRPARPNARSRSRGPLAGGGPRPRAMIASRSPRPPARPHPWLAARGPEGSARAGEHHVTRPRSRIPDAAHNGGRESRCLSRNRGVRARPGAATSTAAARFRAADDAPLFARSAPRPPPTAPNPSRCRQCRCRRGRPPPRATVPAYGHELPRPSRVRGGKRSCPSPAGRSRGGGGPAWSPPPHRGKPPPRERTLSKLVTATRGVTVIRPRTRPCERAGYNRRRGDDRRALVVADPPRRGGPRLPCRRPNRCGSGPSRCRLGGNRMAAVASWTLVAAAGLSGRARPGCPRWLPESGFRGVPTTPARASPTSEPRPLQLESRGFVSAATFEGTVADAAGAAGLAASADQRRRPPHGGWPSSPRWR